MEAESISL